MNQQSSSILQNQFDLAQISQSVYWLTDSLVSIVLLIVNLKISYQYTDLQISIMYCVNQISSILLRSVWLGKISKSVHWFTDFCTFNVAVQLEISKSVLIWNWFAENGMKISQSVQLIWNWFGIVDFALDKCRNQ